MLKKVLTAAVLMTVGIGTASAATVYDKDGTSLAVGGRIQANYNSVFADANDFSLKDRCDHYDADTDTYSDCKSGLAGSARLSVDARSPLASGFYATAYGEWEVAGETGADGTFDTRYATVGFDSDSFGSLVFGQTESAMYNVLSVTDVFQDVGFDAYTLGVGGADSERQEGQIVYNLSVHNFDFGLSYQTAALDGIDAGTAVSAGYTFDTALPFAVKLGYDAYNWSETENDTQSFGAGFSLGTAGEGFYAGTGFQLTRYDKAEDIHSYDVVSGYGFENGFALMLGYEIAERDRAVILSHITAEASYAFNAQLTAYTNAAFGVGDIDEVDPETGRKIASGSDREHDLVTVGLQYNF